MVLAENLNIAVVQIREWQQQCQALQSSFSTAAYRCNTTTPTTAHTNNNNTAAALLTARRSIKQLEGVVVSLNRDISVANDEVFQLSQRAADIESYMTLSLDELEELQKQNASQLEDMESAMDARLKIIEYKDAHAAARQQQIVAKDRHIDLLRLEKAGLEAAIDHCRDMVAMKDGRIAELQGGLASIAELHSSTLSQLQNLQQERAEMESAMDNQREVVECRDVQVSSLQQEILMKGEQITRLRREVAELESTMDRNRSTAADKDAHISELQNSFASVLAQLYTTSQHYTDRINHLQANLEHEVNVSTSLRCEIGNLRALLNHILNSTELATTVVGQEARRLLLAPVEEPVTADLWLRRFTKAPIEVDNIVFSEQACLEKSLGIDVNNAKAWKNLGRICRYNPAVVNSKEYRSQDCFVESLKIDGTDLALWYDLGELLRGALPFTNANTIYSRKVCLAKYLELKPDDSPDVWIELYNELPPIPPKLLLAPKESLVNVGGDELSDVDCRYKAQQIHERRVESDVHNPDLWYNLLQTLPVTGSAMIKQETLTYSDCKRIAQHLYAGRLVSNPYDAALWLNLFKTLPDGEGIYVLGETVSPVQCLANSLSFDMSKDISKLWSALYFKMPKNDDDDNPDYVVTRYKHRKQYFSKNTCWENSRSCDPQSPERDSEFGLEDNLKEIKQYVAAVQDDTSNYLSWYNLFKSLPSGSVVRVGNELRSERDCRIMATQLCTNKIEEEEDYLQNEALWKDLYTLIPTDGTVQVNEEDVDAAVCLTHLLDINPDCPAHWRELARHLNHQQSITVQGRFYDRDECIERARFTAENDYPMTSSDVFDSIVGSLPEVKRLSTALSTAPHSTNARVWYELYKYFPGGNAAVITIEGERLLREDCRRKAQEVAIQTLDKQQDELWAQLHIVYPPNAIFTVTTNGEFITGFDCQSRAVERCREHLRTHPDDVDVWERLIKLLPKGSNAHERETFVLAEKHRREAYIRTENESDNLTSWIARYDMGRGERALEDTVVSKCAVFLASLATSGTSGSPLTTSANTATYIAVIWVFIYKCNPTSEEWTSRFGGLPRLQFLLNALEIAPNHLSAWCVLCSEIQYVSPPNDTVTVDGTVYNATRCLLKAQSIDPTVALNTLSKNF